MPYNNVGLNAEYLKDVEASGRAKEHPSVTSAKAELAPIRARALESLEEFRILCTELRPAYDAARDLAVTAAKQGIYSGPLQKHVNEGYLTMNSGNFQILIHQIDNLTTQQVIQGQRFFHTDERTVDRLNLLSADMSSKLNIARWNIDALRRNADALPGLVAEQQDRIARGGGTPPKPLVGLIAES